MKPDITPKSRIGELLDAYPHLEEVLIAQAPEFGKLRNPILRRTVARVATLENAASIAGLPVARLVEVLRSAAGLGAGEPESQESTAEVTEQRTPGWADPANVSLTIDADALIEAGEMPLGRIVGAARGLEGPAVLRVVSTFRPAPLIEKLHGQGFAVHIRSAGPGRFETFVAAPR